MSSQEFSLHLALDAIEPAGSSGEMYRWAALMAAVSNGPLKKRDKTLIRADDYFPRDTWAPPPPPPKSGAKKRMLAPDFSHLRGLKIAPARPPSKPE